MRFPGQTAHRCSPKPRAPAIVIVCKSPKQDLYAALDQLRNAGAKILFVAQVKPSLEEYFMHLVAADRAQAAAVEVTGK